MFFLLQTFEWKCEYEFVYAYISRVWKNWTMNIKMVMVKDVV